jgi:hypothetical protein
VSHQAEVPMLLGVANTSWPILPAQPIPGRWSAAGQRAGSREAEVVGSTPPKRNIAFLPAPRCNIAEGRD